MGYPTSNILLAGWNYGILGELLKTISIVRKHFFSFETPKELILLSTNNFGSFFFSLSKVVGRVSVNVQINVVQ